MRQMLTSRSVVRLLVLLAVSVAFSSCGGSGSGGATDIDAVTDDAPSVRSVVYNGIDIPELELADIQFIFSEAMDKVSTESAVTFTPTVNCSYTWSSNDSALTCTPVPHLSTDTTYVVTIRASARSASNKPLDEAFTSTFSTGSSTPGDDDDDESQPEVPAEPTVSPTVEAVAPPDTATEVLVTSPFLIEFSESMEQTATENAITISPNIDCSYSWNDSATILTCVPSSALAYGTEYAVTISQGAKSADGAFLEEAHSFTFTTAAEIVPPENPAPYVVATYPQNFQTDVPVGTNIEFLFSIPMNTATVEANASASTTIPCTYNWLNDNTLFVCALTVPLLADSLYVITIGANSQASNGETLGNDYSFLFLTEGAFTLPELSVYGGPFPYNTYLGCLSCASTDYNSVFNRFGRFGRYASPSMMNDFNTYGSAYSTYSACNTFALDPPRVYDENGNYYGKLTINQFASGRLSNTTYLNLLETTVCN